MTTQQQITTVSTSLYRGLLHSTRIPCGTLSMADLRRLYIKLDEKALEAVEKHLAKLIRLPDYTEEQFKALKEEMRSYALLSLIVIGSKGEQIVDQSIKPLDDVYLPEKITSVTYDSFYNFQNKYNILLLDRFKLTLNLLETPSPNSYNPWTQPTPNNSLFEVIGDSQTWVTGVQTLVIDFFKSKGCKRTWIHSQITFNIISWLVGLPGSFWVVYRIDSQFKNALNQLDNALHSAIDIYFFLFAFLVFRVIIHAFRWLFPLIELDENARSFKARTVLTAILSSLLLALLYDVLKTIF